MECKLSVKASPTTLTVDDDGPADFNTIQEAISNATSGDKVLVRVGIYYEHVIVNKSVSLVGEDKDSTIIDGNETGSVISITANNVSIEGFTIKRSGMRLYDSGISVDHSSGNDISHNVITNNYDGISFHSSSSNVVSGNVITNNYDGIGFYSSSSNVVSGNVITNNNYDGISFYYSSNNLISNNTITNNNYYGISLALYSSNNTIYHNNFVDNIVQVWSDSVNVWDYSNEGNYWSDYAGQDLNGDGIGDTSYVIDVNNQDNYPLMGMFSVFEVTWKEETYDVTTVCNSTISNFRFEIGSETGNKIIRFNVTGEDGTVGFCRIMTPAELMNYPYIVLVDEEEITLTLLDVSNGTHVYLYFTYIHSSHTITIISSKTLYLYNELLNKHVRLQIDLYNLNATYYGLLNKYNILLGNYSQLQGSYRELNNSYQEHLLDYSRNVHNIRNLMYIFVATTAIFIITTIYLSKHAHAGKTKVFEDTQKKRTL